MTSTDVDPLLSIPAPVLSFELQQQFAKFDKSAVATEILTNSDHPAMMMLHESRMSHFLEASAGFSNERALCLSESKEVGIEFAGLARGCR